MIIVLITAIAAFISAFDMSVVNIVLLIIPESMNVSVGDISLSVTVYLFVLSGSILTIGRIGDFIGFKKRFLYGFRFLLLDPFYVIFDFPLNFLLYPE